jgi:hypothetical protein
MFGTKRSADGPALRPDSPRLWAGRSARAQSRLGFRVLCYREVYDRFIIINRINTTYISHLFPVQLGVVLV